MVWNLYTLAALWDDRIRIATGEVASDAMLIVLVESAAQVSTAVSAGCGVIVGAVSHALVVWSGSGVRLAQVVITRTSML